MFQSCTFLGGKCVKNLKKVFDDWQLNYWNSNIVKSNNQVVSVSSIDIIENVLTKYFVFKISIAVLVAVLGYIL